MANVRLLRQSVADYQKAIAAGNANYNANYATYAAAVPVYNEAVTAGGELPPLPTPPAAPVLPHEPSITASDEREIRNPGLSPATVALLQSKGVQGKPVLVADAQPAMKGSVFADPEDPQGLKERGVLARVLGGQL